MRLERDDRTETGVVGRDSLLPLERLVFHTGLVVPDTSHHPNPLLRGQEPGTSGRVREEDPEDHGGE